MDLLSGTFLSESFGSSESNAIIWRGGVVHLVGIGAGPRTSAAVDGASQVFTSSVGIDLPREGRRTSGLVFQLHFQHRPDRP